MLGAAHSAANPLTAHYGIVHGQAVGLMLPAVMRVQCARSARRTTRYLELAAAAGSRTDRGVDRANWRRSSTSRGMRDGLAKLRHRARAVPDARRGSRAAVDRRLQSAPDHRGRFRAALRGGAGDERAILASLPALLSRCVGSRSPSARRPTGRCIAAGRSCRASREMAAPAKAGARVDFTRGQADQGGGGDRGRPRLFRRRRRHRPRARSRDRQGDVDLQDRGRHRGDAAGARRHGFHRLERCQFLRARCRRPAR